MTELSEGMRHVAAVLMCPHRWSEAKSQRVRFEGRKKAFDAMVSTCEVCGTNRVDHDGISSLYPPQVKS